MVNLPEAYRCSLVPWRSQRLDLPVFDEDPEAPAFNPSVIIHDEGGYLVFYRSLMKGKRQIAAVRMDKDFRPVSPAVLWSHGADAAGEAITWQADPRALRHRGQVYVIFNTGHSEVPNRQYIVPVDNAGRPVSLPLRVHRADGRQPVEKNWGFFSHEDQLYAIYSLAPLVILRADLTEKEVICRPAFRRDWHATDYQLAFGELRNGAPPLRVGDEYVLITQSHTNATGQDIRTGKDYYGGVMRLSGRPPFAPQGFTSRPVLMLDEAEWGLRPSQQADATVRSVFYPAGAFLHESGRIGVSYGINNYRGGVRIYETPALLNTCEPVLRRPSLEGSSPNGSVLRAFFWQPDRKVDARTDQLAQGLFRQGNVGDALGPFLNSFFWGAQTLNHLSLGGRLMTVGSIGHRVLPGDVVWGCGFKDKPLAIAPQDCATVSLHALRGPMTLEFFQRHGFDVSRVTHLFDSGLLVGHIFRSQLKELQQQAGPPRGVLLIPHYSDAAYFQRYAGLGHKITSVDSSVFSLLRDILGAELVVSSSLHGLIFAEALGRPAIMHAPQGGEPREKYEDYYQGSGRSQYPVIDTLEGLAHRTPPSLPVIDAEAWLATRPSASLLSERGILLPIRHPGRVETPCPGPVGHYALQVPMAGDEIVWIQMEFSGAGAAHIQLWLHDFCIAEGRLPQAGPRICKIKVDWGLVRKRAEGTLHLSVQTEAGHAPVQLSSFQVANRN
jgi:pyruvyltransferase